MKYKKIEEKNYDIYLIKTDKFKTISISTVFISDYKKEEITKEKFISEFILSSNNQAKDEVSMSKKYMKLYGPSIYIDNLFLDKQHRVFGTTFLNEKYTEKGMNNKTIDFYYSIMFDPNMDNGIFNEKHFEITKNKMASWYKMDEEDSRSMAFYNSFSHISDDIPIRIDNRGNLDDLLKIKREELKDYYFDKINKSRVTVFVVGNYDEELIDSIKNNLDSKINKNDCDIKKTYDVTRVKEVTKVIEEKEFNQSIIYLIYKIIGMTDRERNYVLPVLNNILGGSSAKLFNNVREKNSLAYYAYSNFYPSNNILCMFAGISKENYEKCNELMKEQLNEIINGNITDKELNDAINTLESGILVNLDSGGKITNNLEGQVFFGLPSLEEYKDSYKTVTKEEVIELSKKLELDVEYLLKGVK